MGPVEPWTLNSQLSTLSPSSVGMAGVMSERIGQRNERPWGSWTVLEAGAGYKVKRLEVHPGKRLSLQKHSHRSEHWVVVQGTARVTNGNNVFELETNQSTFIPLGAVHRLENPDSGPLVVIEVQSGDDLRETDIVRLEDDFDRPTVTVESRGSSVEGGEQGDFEFGISNCEFTERPGTGDG